MKQAILCAGALLLSACGGGGSAPPALDGTISAKGNSLNADLNRRCTSFTGGTATFTQDLACPQCSGQDTAKAVDSTDETHAEFRQVHASTGAIIVRAIAAKGVVYPAGNNAALTMSANAETTVPVGDGGINYRTSQHWVLVVRTFLDGVKQEEDMGRIDVSDDPDARHISGITTTLPFDSIEAEFSRPVSYMDENETDVVSGDPTDQGGNVNIHEFCGGFDLSGLNVQEK